MVPCAFRAVLDLVFVPEPLEPAAEDTTTEKFVPVMTVTSAPCSMGRRSPEVAS